MRALTVRQPYASLIIEGLKQYETRGWRTEPGLLAIHAGVDKGYMNDSDAFVLKEYVFGAVLGIVTVVECVPVEEIVEKKYGDFRPGRWGWQLEVIEKFSEPVPAKGQLNIWQWKR